MVSLAFAGDFDQRWNLYFSNPRVVSLLLTSRLNQFGSGRFVVIPKQEGSSRWMNVLYPKSIYTSKRGQGMSRFTSFLIPPSLTLRKLDGFETMYATTHDSRTVPIIAADEFCEVTFAGELVGNMGWQGPSLRNYWDDSQNGALINFFLCENSSATDESS